MNKQETGRRERKKQELRAALIDAAYELFEGKGFDETRVEDIADKVDVSSRTFFRYFPSKEDVVLDYHSVEHEEILAALERRPKNESIVTALRRSTVEVTLGCEEGFYGVDGDRFRTLRMLVHTHPLIRARSLEQAGMRKERLVAMISNRLNVDGLKDVRPSIIAGLLDFASSTAYDAWRRPEAEGIPYHKILDEVFKFIEEGMNIGELGS